MLTLLVDFRKNHEHSLSTNPPSQGKMVNGFSKLAGASEDKPTRRVIAPVIPLRRAEAKDLKKGEYVVIKCRIRPNDNDSPTFDLPIPYFGTGTPEEFLTWRDNLSKAIKGQDVTDGPGKFAMARRLLKGDALTAFNNGCTQFSTESSATFNAVIKSLTAHVFPMKALQQQKRYMRRFVRKPFDMKVQDFVSRMGELNEYLTSFPSATPAIAATKLPEDEILDILEFSMPHSWQRQMMLMDFEPIDSTLQEFVHFCQRLEMGESEEKKPEIKSVASKKSKKQGKRKREGSADFTEGLDCMLHGKNCGHTTENCWTLKKQAAATAAQKSKNKSSHSKKEMNVMMKQAVVEAFNAASAAKKPKKSKKEKTEELQAFSKLTVLSDGEIAEAVEESDDGESSASE